MTDLIQVNPTEFGIEETKANELMGNLPQIKKERSILEQQYEEVVMLDIEDAETSKRARELRILIRDNRTKGIDKWHKTTKEVFLRAGQFVDAVKRKETAVNERMEENLETIEKHFEIKEAKRKQELSETRIAELQPYSEFVPLGLNFGEISNEEYAKIFNGAKLQYDAKIEAERLAEEERVEAERKAEEERIEAEKAMIKAREEQRLENERLKAEADKREKEIQAEREANEKKLAQEKAKAEAERKKLEDARKKLEAENAEKLRIANEEKAKVEAELKARQEAERKAEEAKKAEQKRIADEEAKRQQEIAAEEKRLKLEAERKAKAPIQKQLSLWVDEFSIPELNIENEKKSLIIQKFEAFKNWAKTEIEKL